MDPLSVFCIGCAKYASGDTLAKLLAVACTGPYFVVYHCAVVVHARRELHMLSLFVGMLCNAGASVVIKRLVQRPRPHTACALLGKCTGHGWPSSHSQVMAFALVACLLLYRHRRLLAAAQPSGRCNDGKQSKRGSAAAAGSAVQHLELVLLAALTCAVAVGRVYLGYHSLDQVAAGLGFGAALACVWWAVTLRLSATVFQTLERLLAPLGMHWHDSLHLPDQLATAAQACRKRAAAD